MKNAIQIWLHLLHHQIAIILEVMQIEFKIKVIIQYYNPNPKINLNMVMVPAITEMKMS